MFIDACRKLCMHVEGRLIKKIFPLRKREKLSDFFGYFLKIDFPTPDESILYTSCIRFLSWYYNNFSAVLCVELLHLSLLIRRSRYRGTYKSKSLLIHDPYFSNLCFHQTHKRGSTRAARSVLQCISALITALPTVIRLDTSGK